MNSNLGINNDFQDVQRLYQANGLPFPPVPEEFPANVVKISEWVYGTRKDVPSPYSTNAYIDELLTEQWRDYVVFGHAGHGIMSYGLHFYLVKGALALFLQHSWGNADSNPAKDIEYIEKDYLLAAKLIQAVESSPAILSQKQLVVYQSNLRLESKWALYEIGSSKLLWNKAGIGQALQTVLNMIDFL